MNQQVKMQVVSLPIFHARRLLELIRPLGDITVSFSFVLVNFYIFSSIIHKIRFPISCKLFFSNICKKTFPFCKIAIIKEKDEVVEYAIFVFLNFAKVKKCSFSAKIRPINSNAERKGRAEIICDRSEVIFLTFILKLIPLLKNFLVAEFN